MMSKFKNAFKQQQSKYGGYSTLLMSLIILIIIVINLLVGELEWTFDASVNSVFSISKESKTIAKAIDQPVTIYGLYEIGGESKAYDLIISNYTNASKNIKAKNIDPLRNPAFSMKYASEEEVLDNGTYIVVGENTGRYKIIHPGDIIDNTYDTGSGKEINAIVLEQQLTSAIKYVTSDKLPIVYQLSGHGEQALLDSAVGEMELENYKVNSLILLDHGQVPEDCDVLIINGPKADINETELQMLNEYFDNFGSAMFLMGLVDKDMPNFSRLFENYGVKVHQDSVVFENNPSNFYQSPVLLIPDIKPHMITQTLIDQDLRLTAMTSQYITELELVRESILIEPLLSSSNSSYAKSQVSNDTIPEKEAGDADGPFVVATTITDNKEWDSSQGIYRKSKMVIISNSVFLDPAAYAAEPNFDMLIYATHWLADIELEEGTFIRPKNVDVSPLQMNAMEIYLYAGLTVILIPLIILITGFLVWKKRRHL